MDKFTSLLAPLIQGYIVYRKTSGRWNEASYEPNLLLFDRYRKAHYQNATDLSQQMVDRWCRQRNTEFHKVISDRNLVEVENLAHRIKTPLSILKNQSTNDIVIFEGIVSKGQITIAQLENLLKTLVSKHGLTDDEIVNCYAKKGTLIKENKLNISYDSVSRITSCGTNPGDFQASCPISTYAAILSERVGFLG